MDEGENITGADPGFNDTDEEYFTLIDSSACVDSAGDLPSPAIACPLSYQYEKHQGIKPRTDDGSPDMGHLNDDIFSLMGSATGTDMLNRCCLTELKNIGEARGVSPGK